MATKKSFVEKSLASVGVRELRQEASKILDIVKSGKEITITEWGKPVAKLIPLDVSSIDDLIAAGFITPAKAPWDPHRHAPIKLAGGKTMSEVLAEMRSEEKS